MGQGLRDVMLRGVAASLLLLGAVAGATTLLRQGIPDLSRRSDAVLRGTVMRTESRWSGDRRRIFTEVEIRVAEMMKGTPRKTVIVRQPGGVVGNVGQRVDGVASFEQGEEVVVFLARKRDDSFVVEGMAQGKFRVERSSDGRDAFAVPDEVQAQLVDPDAPLVAATERRTLTLEELSSGIRNALAAPNDGQGVTPPVPKGSPSTQETK